MIANVIQERLKAQLFLETLRAAERLAPGQFAQFTESFLEPLISHAVKFPFWEARLSVLSPVHRRFSWNAWSRIPLLTEATAKSVGKEWLAPAVPEENVLDLGAAVQPFRYRDKLSCFADLCVFERIVELFQVPLHVPLVDIGMHACLTPTYWRWNSTFESASYTRLPAAWPAEVILEKIYHQPSGLLRAAPAILIQIADAIMKSDRTPPNLLAVVAMGRTIDQRVYDALSAAFGAPVIAIWYDPCIGIIAYRDAAAGWRGVAATQLVEVVRGDGIPCREGEQGAIAVTSFYGYAMPVIRFVLGQEATTLSAHDGHIRFDLPEGISAGPAEPLAQ